MYRIYTHDEACIIAEYFEQLLSDNGITLPSPEDEEKDPDNEAALYGSTYSKLLDFIEDRLLYILERHEAGTEVIAGEFSGQY